VKRRFARRNAVKVGSNLPKTTGMPNRYTVMSFTKTFFIFEKELKNDIFVVSNLNFGDLLSS
jgi:hypothetical protein